MAGFGCCFTLEPGHQETTYTVASDQGNYILVRVKLRAAEAPVSWPIPGPFPRPSMADVMLNLGRG